MFRVKTATGASQQFMDQLLQYLTGVVCFFDDIGIQGKTGYGYKDYVGIICKRHYVLGTYD